MFFFKQNTADEMRISDWSSDVCSSYLPSPGAATGDADHVPSSSFSPGLVRGSFCPGAEPPGDGRVEPAHVPGAPRQAHACPPASAVPVSGCTASRPAPPFSLKRRSEEHTSELQSLMRISYAVFCLKKKKHKQQSQQYITAPYS